MKRVSLIFIMKRVSLIIIICICSLLLISCSLLMIFYDNDDCVPYENYTDNVNISIESNIFLMNECYPELLRICKKYEKKHAKDMKLAHAEYYFNNEDEDYAIFVLITSYGVYSVECYIYVNTETNTVYKIEYEKGASKRVATYSLELEKTLEIDVKNLYNSIITEELSDKYNDIRKASFVFKGDEININVKDYDNECIYEDTMEYGN